MKDLIKLRQREQRGENANRIINDDLYNEAFDVTKSNLMEAFESSLFDEKEKREDIYRTIRALNHVRAYLTSLMIDGKNAKKELAEIKDPNRLNRFIGL